MKLTVSQLRRLIREAVTAHLTDEEAVVPGRPVYDDPKISPEDAAKLGYGAWPGGWLDEEDLDEESSDEGVIETIVREGVMLAQLGVLDQFELDHQAINEEVLAEAEYHGRNVSLGKPMKGDVKKYKVYVKDPKTGNVKKVNFGDPNMEIRRDNPKARKSFRARHGCGTKRASNRTKAAYWSCRLWSTKPVSKILKGK
jgi:hypothetical protein